jgi:phage-related protein
VNLLDLFAKITLDTSGYEKGLDDASGKASSFATKLKNGLATAAKVGAAALTAAATGVAALTKASINQYAEYEQLVGGVDTLFKTASDKVQQYAANAYKTAGMSANEYMNTVTSFSASLLQSLGGDTEKAAQIADQAITDMADNANKMGTSMEMIQNAYQGFAKQNYTMLDNLKLGYGGTKEEMARLIEDAAKIKGLFGAEAALYANKGVNGDLSIIIDAIHTVQTEMGITGTTAKEAASTISGSLASAKAAWKNLLTGVGDDTADLGTLIDNLVDSVSTAAGNIVPRVAKILSGMGNVIAQLAPIIAQELPALISTVVPAMVSAGAQLLVGLTTGLITALPDLVAAAPQIVTSIVTAISSNLPAVMTAGQQLLTMFGSGIQSGVPQMVAQLPAAIDGFLGFITEQLPAVLDKGVEMLTELANGIIAGIPQLLEQLPLIFESFETFITVNLPVILDKGMDLLFNFVDGIIAGIPNMVARLPEIIKSITTTLSNNYPKIIRSGFDLLIKLADGILSAIPDLVSVLPQVVAAILSGFSSAVSGVFEIGKNIVMGLWDGIKSMGSWIAEKIGDFFGGIVDGAKDLLGIHSPSRVFADIGKNMALGLGNGWEDSFGRVRDGITRGLDFGAASVDFASSGLGVSSAGIINSMAAGSDAGFADGLTVNLTLPDGTKFATWQLPYLIKAGSAAGTPIADPQLA